MKCRQCSQEIPDNTKFCPFCGTPQVLKCPTCGQEAAPGTKFCVNCGTPLGGQAVQPQGTAAQPGQGIASPASGQPQTTVYPPSSGAAAPSVQAPGQGGFSSTVNAAPAYSQTVYQSTSSGPSSAPPGPVSSSTSLHYEAPAGQHYASGQSIAAIGITSTDALAGVGRRFLAVLFDMAILYFVNYFLAKILGGTAATDLTGGVSTNFSLQGPSAILIPLVDLAYYVVLEGMKGATLGKLVCGIRVVTLDGGQISYGAALIRNLLRIVDAIPFVVPYLLGAILVWASSKNQRLGDMAAKTLVVKTSALRGM